MTLGKLLNPICCFSPITKTNFKGLYENKMRLQTNVLIGTQYLAYRRCLIDCTFYYFLLLLTRQVINGIV